MTETDQKVANLKETGLRMCDKTRRSLALLLRASRQGPKCFCSHLARDRRHERRPIALRSGGGTLGKNGGALRTLHAESQSRGNGKEVGR